MNLKERSYYDWTINGNELYYKANKMYEKYIDGVLHENIVEQFKHLFNIYSLTGEKRILEYENSLVEKGIGRETIYIYKNKGMKQSNWMKNSFIKTQSLIENKKYIEVKW